MKRLDAEELIDAKHISKFELGEREPSLVILLCYAPLVGVSIDVLADDDLDLPGKLAGKAKREGVRRVR